jgi:hypothetical protein
MLNLFQHLVKIPAEILKQVQDDKSNAPNEFSMTGAVQDDSMCDYYLVKNN